MPGDELKLRQKLFVLIMVLAVDGLLAAALLWTLPFGDTGGGIKSVGSDSSQEIPGLGKHQKEEKLIALTFDDGPHREYTKKLLDGLKKRDIKATFFLVGENIAGNEDLVKRMGDEGHLIGTHCFSHVDLAKKPLDDACEQIFKTNNLIEGITGRSPTYIRPPYGSWSRDLEECIDMTPVPWDVDPLDWKSQNTQKVVRHIIKNADKHEVILLHDVFGTSVEAALEVIDTLEEQGYTFVTVDELLID